MEIGALKELVALLAGVGAGAFALARMSLSQQRTLIDRFMAFVETGTSRHEAASQGLQFAIERLGEGIAENTQLVNRIADRLRITELSS